MEPSKFVVKCGNYAVLVDLHILALGDQDNANWFSPAHRKEVGSLIRDALEPRVRQFQEARYQKIQSKPRKDLTPTAPLCLEGGNVRLAVHFMKRHVNLRCIVRQHYRELRVFPERVVVCASPPENSALPNGNLNLDVSEQSQSKYFSNSGETANPLPISTATKRAVLQKITRQANIQPQQCQDDQESKSGQVQADKEENGSGDVLHKIAKETNTQPPQSQDDQEFKSGQFPAGESEKGSRSVLQEIARQANIQSPHSQEDQEFKSGQFQVAEECVEACLPVPISVSSIESLVDGKALSSSKLSNNKDVTESYLDTTGPRRRPRAPSSSGEDADHQKTKRLRLGQSAVSSDSNNPSSGYAAPDSVCSPQPEISQTNQSGLATSLRGLSVKPVSSGSSISSRPAAREERKGGEPRTSRLRRLKKS
nr:protein SLX4IP isoform X2 [Danio rerio]|eukprot:XP_017214205.1 protein SLX4IP isoform X2 [Danio rerio]